VGARGAEPARSLGPRSNRKSRLEDPLGAGAGLEAWVVGGAEKRSALAPEGGGVTLMAPLAGAAAEGGGILMPPPLLPGGGGSSPISPPVRGLGFDLAPPCLF
jgi:hypothetical protein